MPSRSTSSTETAASPFTRMALSMPMQGILAALLRAVVARLDELNEAAEKEPTFAPSCCTTCRGTGYTLVPLVDNDDDDDSFTDLTDSDTEDDLETPVAPEVPDVTTADGPENAPSAAELNVPSNAASAASLLAAILAGMGGLGSNDEAPTTSVKPTIVTGASLAGPQVVNALAQAVSATADDTPAADHNPEPAAAAPTERAIPPVHIPIPGFQSLGPHAAPPHVSNANFAPPGSTRWYCVTRGIRVGVFGGWSNTSPYVSGVPLAAYIRHRTLLEALDAYEAAYNQGFVTYL